MEVSGKIKLLSEIQQVSASFKKRELVVTTDEQYPQHILIEFAQDKCDLLSGFKVGENVKVSINLGGREWVNPQGEVKYFNSIKGWRVEKSADQVNKVTAQVVGHQVVGQPFETVSELNEVKDDLPF